MTDELQKPVSPTDDITFTKTDQKQYVTLKVQLHADI
jgi:hypothetical protein